MEYQTSKTKLSTEWIHFQGNIYICRNCNLVWVMSNEKSPAENEMHYCPRCGGKAKEKTE